MLLIEKQGIALVDTDLAKIALKAFKDLGGGGVAHLKQCIRLESLLDREGGKWSEVRARCSCA